MVEGLSRGPGSAPLPVGAKTGGVVILSVKVPQPHQADSLPAGMMSSKSFTTWREPCPVAS